VPDDAAERDGEGAPEKIPDEAPPGEPAGTRYVGGRRLRTF
jgi:hypothetical protein